MYDSFQSDEWIGVTAVGGGFSPMRPFTSDQKLTDHETFSMDSLEYSRRRCFADVSAEGRVLTALTGLTRQA